MTDSADSNAEDGHNSDSDTGSAYLQPHTFLLSEKSENQPTYELHSSRVGDEYQTKCPELMSSTLDYNQSRILSKLFFVNFLFTSTSFFVRMPVVT
jgi:hypothetical protein